MQDCKGIHHTHTHWLAWSLQDIHLRLVYQRLTTVCQFKCSVSDVKTKCHRSPSLMSYNISEIDVNSIKSNQIKSNSHSLLQHCLRVSRTKQLVNRSLCFSADVAHVKRCLA